LLVVFRVALLFYWHRYHLITTVFLTFGIGQEFLPGVFGKAFLAGAVTPLVLRCCAHALLLTIAKVNIVSTSLKVTLRKLVMTQVSCGTRRAAIANW
jgi:hypothetical protein